MSTASEIEMLAEAQHLKIQQYMNAFRPVVEGMVLRSYGGILCRTTLPKRSVNSRLLVSRNKREGWYRGVSSPGWFLAKYHSRTKNPHLKLHKPKLIFLDHPEFGVMENFRYITSPQL